MRLGLKLALVTICIVSILFAISGSFITSVNFQNSLDREKESAKESYISLLENIGALKSAGVIESLSDIANVLSQYESENWVALNLSIDGKELIQEDSNHLFSYFATFEPTDSDNKAQIENDNLAETHDEDEMGSVKSETPLLSHITVKEADNKLYINISGKSIIDSSTVSLNMLRDITFIYETRQNGLHLFSAVFALLVVATAIASLLGSYILTRPLSRLSKATREIATNNLSTRSQVRTDDEIGDLSKDFDKMASKIEKNVNDMQLMLDRQKSFMGSFAHEMKTPMTSVIGYSDLIRQGLLEEKDKELAAQYVFLEGKRLESLSAKLLELFLVEDGEIEKDLLDPSILIESILSPLKAPYSEMGIELMWNVNPGILELDDALFRSLILNFVENSRRALSTTSHPKILIKGSTKQLYYEISVTDNGNGIPKEDLGRLTEEFYRVDKARSRKSGGAGLGLALCQRIVHAHNGTMSFESSVGKGTCVRVKLPIPQSEQVDTAFGVDEL